MNYIKEYFHGAWDFVGEEQGNTYRRYCLIHTAGLVVLNVVLPLFASIVLSLVPFQFLHGVAGLAVIAVSILWVVPIVAATVRRTWTLKKSRIWVFLVLFPGWSLLAWLFLGNDKES